MSIKKQYDNYIQHFLWNPLPIGGVALLVKGVRFYAEAKDAATLRCFCKLKVARLALYVMLEVRNYLAQYL